MMILSGTKVSRRRRASIPNMSGVWHQKAPKSQSYRVLTDCSPCS
jgi:hypothetical protein